MIAPSNPVEAYEHLFASSPTANGKANVARSVLSMLSAQGFKILTQFFSVIILSRMLAAHEFGIVAMINPLLQFAGFFQELGLGQAIIHRKDLNHQQASNIFWVGFTVSFFIGIILLAFTPLISIMFHDREAVGLYIGLAVLMPLYPLSAIHIALLNRAMQMRSIAIMEATVNVLALAATVTFALFHPTCWAIYCGSVVIAIFPIIAAWAITGWVPALPARGTQTLAMAKFGGAVTTANVANFIGRNLDNILIGKYVGPYELGIYDRAYKLLLYPLTQIVSPIQRALLPLLSQASRDEDSRYSSIYIGTMAPILFLSLPGIAIIQNCTALVINVFLGAKWGAAAAIFGWLGYAAMAQVFNGTAQIVFVSQGRTRALMGWSIFASATAAMAFAFGLHTGALGVAKYYALSELVKTPLLWIVVTRCGPLKAAPVASLIACCITGIGAAIGAMKLVDQLLGSATLVAAGCAVVAAYLAFAVAVLPFPVARTTFRLAIGYFKKRAADQPWGRARAGQPGVAHAPGADNT